MEEKKEPIMESAIAMQIKRLADEKKLNLRLLSLRKEIAKIVASKFDDFILPRMDEGVEENLNPEVSPLSGHLDLQRKLQKLPNVPNFLPRLDEIVADFKALISEFIGYSEFEIHKLYAEIISGIKEMAEERKESEINKYGKVNESPRTQEGQLIRLFNKK